MAKPHPSLPQKTLVIKFYGSARPLWGWETELEIESPFYAITSPFKIHDAEKAVNQDKHMGGKLQILQY